MSTSQTIKNPIHSILHQEIDSCGPYHKETEYLAFHCSHLYRLLLSKIQSQPLAWKSILLNIMFHAPMTRFQLEYICYFAYFSPLPRARREKKLVENVVLTTKGLQERNTQLLDGKTVKNRCNNNKLIPKVCVDNSFKYRSVRKVSELSLFAKNLGLFFRHFCDHRWLKEPKLDII